MTIVFMIPPGAASARPAVDLGSLLSPRALAIVGASPTVARHTGRAMANLLRTGYAGTIYPVNPRYREVMGVRCLASAADLPPDVDVAYVLVRAELVLPAVEECARAGVRNVVVCTSGFAEEGEAGRALQEQLTGLARRTGTRIVGPNCIGILDVVGNVVATPTLNIAEHIAPGRVTVVSQSGGMGVNVVNIAQGRGVGIRALVSVGNECDVDVADLVGALADDAHTAVIALFLEQIRRVGPFLDAVRRAHGAGKRIVALKVGAGDAAARSALGHTGAMTGSHRVFTAVMAESGVVTVRTLDELVDVAGLLAAGPPPVSGRLLIVSPSGGECSYVADRAEAAGLCVPALRPATAEKLAGLMRFGTPGNPLDLTGQVIGDATLLRDVTSVLADDDGADVILFAVPTWTGHDAERLLPVIVDAARASSTLAVVSTWAANGMTETAERILADAGVPVFAGPDTAVRALRALATMPPVPAAVQVPVQVPVQAPVQAPAELPARWRVDPPTEHDAGRYAAGWGIPFPAELLAQDAAEAMALAGRLRWPIVAKQLCRGVTHKSDLGLVRTDIRDRQGLATQLAQLAEVVAGNDLEPAGILLAEQAIGLEMIVGGVRDADFGPMIMVGAGGVLAEVLADTALARCPVDAGRAAQLIGTLRIARVLSGYRGQAHDVAALAHLVARASQMFAAAPWMAGFDLNPVLVGPAGHGAMAVDASIAL
jgi:acyl-CoA synthetase (NDP forming)